MSDNERWAVIDVPEFGEGYTVNVKMLTPAEKAQLAAWIEDKSYQAPAVIAALAAYDDNGRLVFGTNRADAVQRAATFGPKYWPAFQRIAKAAIALEAGHEVDSAGNVKKDGEQHHGNT